MISQRPPLDVETLLEFYNPAKGRVSCVGFTQKGARCCNPINMANRASALGIADRMNQIDPTNTNAMKTSCDELAGCLLCIRFHQYQLDETTERWLEIIRQSRASMVEPTVVQETPSQTQEINELRQQRTIDQTRVRDAELARDRMVIEHQREIHAASAAHEDALQRERNSLQHVKTRIEQAQAQWLREQQEQAKLRHAQEDQRREKQTKSEREAFEQRQLQDQLDRDERLRDEERGQAQRKCEELQIRAQRLREEKLAREQRMCDEGSAREQRLHDEESAREQRLYEETLARDRRLREELHGRAERLRVEQAAADTRAQQSHEREMEVIDLRERLLRETASVASLRAQLMHLNRRGEILRLEEEAQERDHEASIHLDEALEAEQEADRREAEAASQRAEAVRLKTVADQAKRDAVNARSRVSDLERMDAEVTMSERSMCVQMREHQRREQILSSHRRQEQVEWHEVWTRHERDWVNLLRLDRRHTLDEDVRDSLPWPVRSGRWQDVTDRSVQDFFSHVQHRPHAAVDATWNTRMLRRQALRWQEDYLVRMFPRAKDDADVLTLVGVVAAVIGRLRDAALLSSPPSL
nr:hypothetical protein CFP56_31692 [Quercus suber]